jgi:acyl-coenzyme A thioesterase PaaI-like protein
MTDQTPGDRPRTLAEMLSRDMARSLAEPQDPHRRAAKDLGTAVRDLIEELTASGAPAQVLDAVAAQVARATAMLQDQGAHRAYEGLAEASGHSEEEEPADGAYGASHFDWSPLLGIANPLAPPIRCYIEHDVVVGLVTFGSAYEGPPGWVHGGHIAAAFDEVLGLSQSLSGQAGMTGTLTIKYRRPTPLHTELRFEGRLESVNGRKVTATAELIDPDGQVTAEGSGLFIRVSPDHFRGLAAGRDGKGPA